MLKGFTFHKIERKDKAFSSDSMDIIALEISLKSADQLGLKEWHVILKVYDETFMGAWTDLHSY